MLAVRQNEQKVMENIVAKTTDEMRGHWETAIKDKRFDGIRNWSVCETRPAHFDRPLHPPKLTMLPHATTSRWPSILSSLLLAPLADFHCSRANGRPLRSVALADSHDPLPEHILTACWHCSKPRLDERILSNLLALAP